MARPSSTTAELPLRKRYPVLTRLAALPGLAVCLWGIVVSVPMVLQFDPKNDFSGFGLIFGAILLAWAVPAAIPLLVGVIRGGWVPHLLGYAWLLLGVLALFAFRLLSGSW
ncbi:hypothetical protein [Enemella sp. A6]|uniref:hypothetical protein n=1 Tax=Enemella sp. A6 TaxID=3440152 RepID=UPI003EB7CFE6